MTETSRLAFALVALLLLPVSASAQTVAEEQAAEEEEEGASVLTEGTVDADGVVTIRSDHTLSDEQAVLEEDAPVEATDDGIDPTERPNTDYFSVGALFRGIIIPDFMQDLFVDYTGGTPVNMGMGAYFNWRRNGFNVIAEVWYAGFQNQGYYRGIGDPDSETELVQSQLGVVFGNFVFGWAFDLTNWFAIELGFGLGFGGMVGDLYRQEAYRDSTGNLQACRGVQDPDPSYCERGVESADGIERPGPNGHLDGGRVHGGTYQIQNGSGPGTGPSPFYFGDGGIPPMFFWIDLPRIGIRIRPIRQIQIRLDGGYNLFGFNFGGSIGYGF